MAAPGVGVLMLRLRIDGEYLAHEVMRQALRDVIKLQAGDPFCATMQVAADGARKALAVAAELEGAVEA